MRKVPMILLWVALPILITACETSPKLSQKWAERCAYFGLEPGTAEYVDCIQKERHIRSALQH